MTKFNVKDKRGTRTAGPLTTSPVATGATYNGAPGYEYDTLSQLFLLACTNMVGEDTFYESGKLRDDRYAQLIQKAVIEGHIDWLKRFFPWLRHQANMRSAALVGATIASKIMVSLAIPGSRALVNDVLVRADEPGEMLAFYMTMFGRSIPKPIKRGVADAAGRLYTEYNALKYDTATKGMRFGSVIELTHANPADGNGALFKHLLARAHRRDNIEIHPSLQMFAANAALRMDAKNRPEVLLNTARLRQAGMTWEDVLSLGGDKLNKRDMWRAIIPEMGFMALLRNLRNFDENDVKGDVIDWVRSKLTSPAEVAKSRQLPMRFWSAYRNVPSNRWAQPLETALDLCLNNLPTFAGRTLILIDTSGSMAGKLSAKSQLSRADAAVLFGLALAARCHDADVVAFSGITKVFPAVKGASLLKSVTRFRDGGYIMNGNTDTHRAVVRHYNNHDRVVCLTDEQADSYPTGGGVYAPVPGDKMVITVNLAGYRHGHAAAGTGNRVTIGGLSDALFGMIPAFEGRARHEWPF
jgi:TROVE domain